MNTTGERHIADSTRSERRGIGATAASQWWKVWVLVASLWVTVLGWMVFPTDAATDRAASSSNEHVSPRVAPVLTVRPLDPARSLEPNVGALPLMPQKPIFQAPVTRTRRS